MNIAYTPEAVRQLSKLDNTVQCQIKNYMADVSDLPIAYKKAAGNRRLFFFPGSISPRAGSSAA